MEKQHINKAIELISVSNSPKVSFNVPVRDNYSTVHDIIIHECNAKLIRELVEEGFSLSMTPKGLSVDNYHGVPIKK